MTVAATPTGRYQIGLYGEDNGTFDALTQAIRGAIENLGVNGKQFLLPFGMRSGWGTRDPRMPAVTIYFGSEPPIISDDVRKQLLDLIDNGVLVIPVVPDKSHLTAYVPDILHEYQGITREDCGDAFERLAARVLEGFGLLREKRRLFISYRRTESSGVATQLYEALDIAGFDVFLDTHGAIHAGEPFQEILWHRLADTDVVILLDTPGFLSSRWTEEELARANTSNIQMLQILWPEQDQAAGAAFSTFYALEKTDFQSHDHFGPAAQLIENALRGIVDAVEGLRARALGARQTYLISEFFAEAHKISLKPTRTLERNVLVSNGVDSPILIVPAIGIPDSQRYQEIDAIQTRDIGLGLARAKPAVLLFDETGIRSRWLDHLTWLNGTLKCARTISIQNARDFLATLKGTSP